MSFLQIGAYAAGVLSLSALALLLWRPLRAISHALAGKPPKGADPGERGLLDEVRYLGKVVREVKATWNTVATDARRAVEVAETADARVSQLGEQVAEHERDASAERSRVAVVLDSLKTEVQRISQRMREQTEVAATVEIPHIVIDAFAQYLRDQDEEGAGGET